MTPGQADRFKSWLLAQAEAADAAAEGAKNAPRWEGYHRGQAQAWRDAERAFRVAQVGAL